MTRGRATVRPALAVAKIAYFSLNGGPNETSPWSSPFKELSLRSCRDLGRYVAIEADPGKGSEWMEHPTEGRVPDDVVYIGAEAVTGDVVEVMVVGYEGAIDHALILHQKIGQRTRVAVAQPLSHARC